MSLGRAFVPLLALAVLCMCSVVAARPSLDSGVQLGDETLQHQQRQQQQQPLQAPESPRPLLKHPALVAAQDGNGTLPKFPKLGKVYVSGVSSGGYMANQLHVAYSSMIAGAGIFAAGPYGCAQGNLFRALYTCTDSVNDLDVANLQALTASASALGTIDNLRNLVGAPVWVFHGRADATVKRPVSDAGVQFYRHFGADVRYNNHTIAAHAWVSPLGANQCAVSASPYTSNCESDPQAAMLTHLFRRAIQAPNRAGLRGRLTPFSQDRFTLSKWALPASMLSMDSTGYVYAPPQCASGQAVCDVMVVLHGCEQAASIIGLDLVQQANINEYADSNDFIVLYPQTIALTLGAVLNPKACWDWWGYLAADTMYAVKGSYQMEVIMAMLQAMRE